MNIKMSFEHIAYFRCEASLSIGAGHAIRCSVLADALVNKNWKCSFVTTSSTYELIPSLSRFERIDPDAFYGHPIHCDLLIFDNYDLDASYEKHFRPYAKKILVIDDLADRSHDCDILLDHTYGRKANDYRSLVPNNCEILTGSDYIILRPEFIKLRPQALEKRKNTKEIKKILVSMGGSDPKNFTLEALKLIKKSGFKGMIDVVLGFTASNMKSVESFITSLPNKVTFHTNANMAQLTYEADLAIGAAGTSTWERFCLGLPSHINITAENQKEIYKNLILCNYILTKNEFYSFVKGAQISRSFAKIVDGFGCNRVLMNLLQREEYASVSLRQVTHEDKEMIWNWQCIKGIRQYFNNPEVPTYEEHEKWFKERLEEYGNPYWIICYNKYPIGAISLSFCKNDNTYVLSWYLLPQYQGKGLGTKSLKIATQLVSPFSIRAEIKEENIASGKSLKKAGFKIIDTKNYLYVPDYIS